MRLSPRTRVRLAVTRFVIGVWPAMRTVLTGGTGVIGRAAVTALLEAGHDVVVVTRSAAGSALVDAARCHARPRRRADLDEPRRRLRGRRRGDQPGHQACRSATAPCSPEPGDDTTGCARPGVANVVEAARTAGVRRVVQESVSMLYADQGDEWITEQSPVEITPMTEPAAVGESLRAGLRLRLPGRRRAPVRHDRRRRPADPLLAARRRPAAAASASASPPTGPT